MRAAVGGPRHDQRRAMPVRHAQVGAVPDEMGYALSLSREPHPVVT
jgi:hypothetical protein